VYIRQIRLMLPSWLGCDDAFEEFLTQNPDGMEKLREMSKSWPFFQMYMDMLEMVIAKADADIVAYYEIVIYQMNKFLLKSHEQ